MAENSISRRRFLAASGGLGTSLLAALARPAETAQPRRRAGRFVRTLTLGDGPGSNRPPLNQLVGSGLDARLFTDLSGLAAGAMITPNDHFYVRTECPIGAAAIHEWMLALGGDVRRPQTLRFDTLERLVSPMGTHLLECAGNTNPNNYGLMSVARWDGIPLGALLDRIRPVSPTSRVLVAGVDDDQHPSRTSTPGASWIFSRVELERARAFLATRMNGAPLPPHHGAPIRLVVPGWYGCACIKWVNRIDLVADGAEATSQMREFAARTHQASDATRAREFSPAVIDVAAVPVRVEQWAIDGRPVYRIIGIVWGGSVPTRTLQIRFRTDGLWVDVSDYRPPQSTATWSLWSHDWRPAEPGRYQVVLRTKDPGVRTRRLDLFFYVRSVEITET
jgi:DMSO/TMAO reductase YedYZ molybdopterin-dependent catalytic subunit